MTYNFNLIYVEILDFKNAKYYYYYYYLVNSQSQQFTRLVKQVVKRVGQKSNWVGQMG